METVALARNAMNTRFEVVLHGEDRVALQAAGEEALGEIVRIESILSAFQSSSEIAHLNARGAHQPVQLSPEVFNLLRRSYEFWEFSGGAFDITMGPLMRCWGFWGGTGRVPEPNAIEAALAVVGMPLLELNSRQRTVRFKRDGMALDLGAIGKGYAIDQAAELLTESGVRSGLLHGGTSTAYAIGAPPDQACWRMAADCERLLQIQVPDVLPEITIRDQALSVSSVSEKSFTEDGAKYGHVIDPRTGRPVVVALLAVVSAPTAVEADALSTALMVLGRPGLARLVGSRPGLGGWVMGSDGRIETAGATGAAADPQ